MMLTMDATPLLRAAKAGDVAAIKLLLAHGADPNLPQLWGITPLMAAAQVRLQRDRHARPLQDAGGSDRVDQAAGRRRRRRECARRPAGQHRAAWRRALGLGRRHQDARLLQGRPEREGQEGHDAVRRCDGARWRPRARQHPYRGAHGDGGTHQGAAAGAPARSPDASCSCLKRRASERRAGSREGLRLFHGIAYGPRGLIWGNFAGVRWHAYARVLMRRGLLGIRSHHPIRNACMFLTRKSLLLAVLGCAGIASAAAQGVPQTILDCVDLKRDAARLACFDREVAHADTAFRRRRIYANTSRPSLRQRRHLSYPAPHRLQPRQAG